MCGIINVIKFVILEINSLSETFLTTSYSELKKEYCAL
jgi:hypothetical protein